MPFSQERETMTHRQEQEQEQLAECDKYDTPATPIKETPLKVTLSLLGSALAKEMQKDLS